MVRTAKRSRYSGIGFRAFRFALLLCFLLIRVVPAIATFQYPIYPYTFVEQSGRVSLVPEGDATTNCFFPDDDVCFGVAAYPGQPAIDLPNKPCENSNFPTFAPCFFYIADPSGLLISHIVSLAVWENLLTLFIGIRSASDPLSGLGTCAAVGGCQLVKDGTVQLIGWVRSSDGDLFEIRFQSLDVISRPSISVAYDGTLTDRVGQEEFARNPDGQLDGVFTVTLNPGGGNRVVNRLDLVRNGGDGVWNTNPGDVFWTLGAASDESAPLLNDADDRVNFAIADGASFKIFAANFQNRMFTPESTFLLTASFSDGTTATASVTIPITNVTPTLTYNGTLRDRVGQNNLSQGVDGHLDPTFTVSFPTNGTARTVTSLRLESGNGGVWDTSSTTGFWTLGAATNLDAPLYNAMNDAVSFTASPGGNFILFASDWFFGAPFPNGLFLPGNTFTLTIGFSDGGTATATTTVPGNNNGIILAYNGPLQDRVGDNNLSVRADGVLDQTFTITFSSGGITRTVTSLRLDSSDGGVWDTNAATGFWTLAAATNLQSPSYNAADDSVNFAVPAGGTFMIFASDSLRGAPFANGLFQKGKGFTLTIGFSDGSTVNATTTIP